MLTVRLSRGGRKNDPIYSIVVTDSRKPRDGGFLAKLGQYAPKQAIPLTGVKLEEIKHHISKGAQLSDTVRTLLKKQKIALS
jgi:small subunit ribosomal protein S16